MKQFYFVLLCLFLFIEGVDAQVKANGSFGGSISGSSVFDASSSSTWNSTASNAGKGLAWPRTDLTLLNSLSSTYIITNKYDGTVVYNTATGTAALGFTAVSPGFYYYYNKTTNVNGGKWIRLLDNNVSSSDVTYYGVLATTTPTATDITGLANKKNLASGVYTGNLDLTVSTAGYFTVAIPASWRNPSLKIDGNETMNVMQLVSQVVINNVNYQVWQTDVSLSGGKLVSIN